MPRHQLLRLLKCSEDLALLLAISLALVPLLVQQLVRPVGLAVLVLPQPVLVSMLLRLRCLMFSVLSLLSFV
jgi:hypothetical protein